MKAGVRALGIAESSSGDVSTLAGVVVRASRVVDDVSFATCTVGGADATASVCDLVGYLDREDVRYILIAGIAPAWFNILNLETIAERTDRPTVSVSFEASPGLTEAIREAFDEPAATDRLDVYHAQPDRRRIVVNDHTLWIRAVGLEGPEARDVVRAFTPTGGRPEPLRVARQAARAADAARRRWRSKWEA